MVRYLYVLQQVPRADYVFLPLRHGHDTLPHSHTHRPHGLHRGPHVLHNAYDDFLQTILYPDSLALQNNFPLLTRTVRVHD